MTIELKNDLLERNPFKDFTKEQLKEVWKNYVTYCEEGYFPEGALKKAYQDCFYQGNPVPFQFVSSCLLNIIGIKVFEEDKW